MARTKRKINPVQQAPVPAAPQRRVYKTGGYARLSVEDGGRPGADTLELQEDLIREYIQAQPDMRFCGLYSDNGRTGTNFARPAFERLMEDVRAGRIDCIVVKDLSRFGRNYKETGNYLERVFPYLDVRFIAVNDSFDTLTAERTNDGYIVPLKNIINDVYSKDISRKSGSALAIKQQRGEFLGVWVPYGYRKCAEDSHRIEPDEETAPVVRLIFQWRLSGMSYIQIARRLNDEKILSPSRYHYLKGDIKASRCANAIWHCEIIKVILKNEVYLGHMVQGRKRSGFCEGQKQKHVPKSDWVIVRNTHEPLIDEETFRAVQEIAAERYNIYCGHTGQYGEMITAPNMFRGLIFCADCKRPMVRHRCVSNRHKELYYVFICQTHTEDLRACPKKYLHEAELKEVLWDVLKKQIEMAGRMEKLVRQYGRFAAVVNREKSLDREANAARQALERARMLHDSLYQNYVDHLMTELEYVEMKQRYKADMEEAQERLEDIERRRRTESKRVGQNPWLSTCVQFHGEAELTEGFIRALIERIEVDADNHIEVKLRHQDECRALIQLLEKEGVLSA